MSWRRWLGNLFVFLVVWKTLPPVWSWSIIGVILGLESILIGMNLHLHWLKRQNIKTVRRILRDSR